MTSTDASPTPRVNTVTRGGEEVRVLVLRHTVAAEAAEVWAALTQPDRVERWLEPVSGVLEAGGTFRLGDRVEGEVLDCVAHERFALTWRAGDRTGWIDVSLRPVADGTLRQLDHSAPLSAQRWAEVGPAEVGAGWEAALHRLAEHLAAPDAPSVPRTRPAATYDAWAGAAIADGDDPERARAAAARAAAARGGEATEG